MKYIHAGLNTIALTLAIIALVAVFDFHNAQKIPNMYSLHSWIGLIAVILYALQVRHLFKTVFKSGMGCRFLCSLAAYFQKLFSTTWTLHPDQGVSISSIKDANMLVVFMRIFFLECKFIQDLKTHSP